MLFNSIEFAIFLPAVFIIYWYIFNRNLKLQNLFLIGASFLFYGWWDWRFLFLMVFSAGIDFFAGIMISRSQSASKRKLFLTLSILTNLGILGFFKYFNFFVDNFVEAFSFFGAHLNPVSLRIILPVGVSFYTFQALSYTIDVYRGKLPPTYDPIQFYAFISFFPQLVAGPIERATNLLSQFYTKRVFDYNSATDGLRQILWGLFKKIVIADNCAEYANQIFNNSSGYSGSTLILGALFFTFQIYADFSGYSDIAIGTARLFGFNLMRNFAFPYFSRDIAEFWRRWHISLTTWFRDYIYIPLGGSRGGTWLKVRNTFIIFIVSGFWHGANWTFVIWGVLNAIYFLPLLLMNKNRNNIEIVAQGKYLPSLNEFFHMFFTFGLTVFAWIFFRSESVGHALSILSEVFSKSLFTVPDFMGIKLAVITILITILFVIVEWIGRDNQYAIAHLGIAWPRLYRWSFYFIIITCIFVFSTHKQEFIYFQF